MIFRLFATHGTAAYVGEPVSQLDHALQTAARAVEQRVPSTLVVAALLHDIGHLLHATPEAAAACGIDTRHQEVGFVWLSSYFPVAVTLPIRRHVAAKRYLCTVDATYQLQLSAASRHSLSLQGAMMTEEEVDRFRTAPGWQEAVLLRRWDDEAKVPGLCVPPLEFYRSLLVRALAEHEGSH